MNPKVAVIGLAVVVVAVVLVLVFGAVRPTGQTTDARPGLDSALGWLRSTGSVPYGDLATGDVDCADPSAEAFVVPGGGSCAVPVPDHGSLELCATSGQVTLLVDGERYPAQHFGPDGLACPDDVQIDLYDSAATLLIRCALGEACSVEVPEPR